MKGDWSPLRLSFADCLMIFWTSMISQTSKIFQTRSKRMRERKVPAGLSFTAGPNVSICQTRSYDLRHSLVLSR
jgi:hypothetical protein